MSTCYVDKDKTYVGWTEYDVKEKGWQVYTLGGDTYIKKDFSGNFINVQTGQEVKIGKIFHLIRNVTDAQGYILAKRKNLGSPLGPTKSRKKIRIPVYK
ncbi:hypothetical protein B4065_1367 [Caldibacillus thermoamylovorans]|uniref:hypothetical protein n=1 Tax=Caldibacillus thermoamylovorans TaxID=35841 RepID=UPI0005A49F2B|nr:hypothetical protein [Caldibacillus thermoamylovorans]KIO69701.1 hypothetical protein B4065_1367 [Caldibacillus thermoamylovorans]